MSYSQVLQWVKAVFVFLFFSSEFDLANHSFLCCRTKWSTSSGQHVKNNHPPLQLQSKILISEEDNRLLKLSWKTWSNWSNCCVGKSWFHVYWKMSTHPFQFCYKHCVTAEESCKDPQSTFIQRANPKSLIIFPCLAAFSSSPKSKIARIIYGAALNSPQL